MLSFSMMSNGKNPYESLDKEPYTGVIGQKVIYFPSVTSTMDIARDKAREGFPEGTVIIAGTQTGGRGRKSDRIWLSPPGNVAFSVVLYPEVSNLACLIMIASLAVVRGIKSVAGLEADIKWPNDILIGGKKVGGILIMNEISGDKTVKAIVGIGVNIAIDESAVKGNALPVTSLEKETRKAVDKAALVKRILGEMDRLYARLPDAREIFSEWRKKLITLGKRVVVTSDDDVIEGIADSVEPDGALIVRLGDGMLTRVVAGDVTLREK